VTLDRIASELERLPLDGVLGAISVLSLKALQLGIEFWSPGIQRELLADALLDDFPTKVKGAWTFADRSREPHLPPDHGLVHEHGLAALTHLALLHADARSYTPQIDAHLRRRVLRLLLLLNDHLYISPPDAAATLEYRRAFVADHLRSAQFNAFFTARDVDLLMHLGRQWLIYCEYLPRHYPGADDRLQAAAGVTVEEYFLIIAMMIAAIHHSMKGTWFALDPLLADLAAGSETIRRVLKSWITTPASYRQAWSGRTQGGRGGSGLYDLVPLRMSPIVEARPGELLCPAPSLMFGKMFDGPFFLVTEQLSGDPQERDRFHSSLGRAYEDYAHELAERIARQDQRGAWRIWKGPGKGGAEYTDSYLLRENTAIAMEHKGGRVETDFLMGGNGRRVVGPEATVLERLETGGRMSFAEGKNGDRGLLTRPMWQQNCAADDLMTWSEENGGLRPSVVYPLITHLAHLFVDDWVRSGYLDVLAERGGLYALAEWQAPQWLSIVDLECLAARADAGCLDLSRLLAAKDLRRDERFDVFLRRRYTYTTDRRVHQTGLQILERAKERYWPRARSP
jgi:hypothetical protein